MKELALLLLCAVAVYGLGDNCDNCLPAAQLRIYEQRGCKPFKSPECNCPLYYDCPQEEFVPELAEVEKLKLKQLGENACIFDDKVYAIDENLGVHCRVCHCRAMEAAKNVSGHMIKGDAFGPCADIECPEMFNPHLEPGCHLEFAKDRCCSSGKICKNHPKSNVKCSLDGKTFNYGEKIFPKSQPCHTCLCDEKFNENDLEASTCYAQQCNIARETNKPVFAQHCTPVYFKNSCCPMDYICTKNFDPEGKTFEARPQKLTDTCVLNGKSFKIGEKMTFTNDDTYAKGFMGGDCKCQVPPLMTCYYNTN